MRGDPNINKLAADLKRYARVEKIPGGTLEDARVLNGVMVNKDVTHPGMRRRIKNPRILLLDIPLEYKKGESKPMLKCVPPKINRTYFKKKSTKSLPCVAICSNTNQTSSSLKKVSQTLPSIS
jgi:chaperonin GroEL (HSP60 family)